MFSGRVLVLADSMFHSDSGLGYFFKLGALQEFRMLQSDTAAGRL